MPEVTTATTATTATPATTAPASVETHTFDAAMLTRLRGLSRPGHDLKTFVTSVSPFEIAALVVLLLLVVSAFFVYISKILPDQVRYAQASSAVSENQTKIEELQQKIVDPSAITSQYKEVRDSLDSFRGSVLKPEPAGKLDILQAIDKSTRETGVHLAGPVQFRSDDLSEANGDASRKKGKSKTGATERAILSYPSLKVDMAVSGTYAQLRSFISRFEGGGQFVVINGVELESNDLEKGAAGGRGRIVQPLIPTGPITLNITMTAYFQPIAQGAAIP
jgi:hypothetical protein